MRKLLLLCVAVFGFGFAQAQDHSVLAGNYYYIPSTLTVTAGETIEFLNEAGFHNVNGVSSTLGDTWNNPETFSLAANSGAAGGVSMGTITLNTPGTYQYDCSIGSHAANGMVGTIIVEAAANTVDVTFNVNMANETTSPDGVFLAGGADFGVAGDNPMSDDDGDDIWTITMPVSVGYTGNYTFLNGNCPDWSCKENINGQSCADGPYADRLLSNITENTTISTCFSQCTTDGTCEAPSYQPIVTFQVDMSNSELTGTETIYVTGSFDGWCGPCTAMSDDNGDNIYTVDMALSPSQGYEFKYMINGWGGDESAILGTDCDFVPGDGFGNRGFDLGTADTTLAVQCFNYCGTCEEQNALATYDLTFNVNTETITVGPNGMYLGGGVFGDATAHAMSDDDADGIWTVTVSVEEGTSGNYIFLNSPNDGGDWGAKEDLTGLSCADPGNFNDRILPAVTGPATFSTCFGQCSTDGTCGSAPASYAVTFQVDMSEYAGTYGTVNLNGTFAGWCGDCIAMDDSDGDGVYTVSVDIAEGTIEYKFTLDGWTAQEEFAGGESCTSTIDGFTNRTYDVTADATLPVVCYNSCEACDGSGGGDPTDMYDVTFNVNTENITVGPNGMFLGGGVFGDAMAHAMSDDDGDGTYTVTVNVAAGTSGNYIFLNSPNDGGDWAAKENLGGLPCSDPGNFDDRILAPVTENTTISTCYEQCSTDGSCEAPPATFAVTFQVDMSEYTGTYGTVNLNGSFAGWCGACIPMDDSDADGIYTVTVDIAPDTIEYKFTLDGWTAQEEFAGGESCTSTIDGFTNRSYAVEADATLPVVCYNSCDACGGGVECLLDSAMVTLTVDMSEETVNPIGVFVAGTFQGWSPGSTLATDNGDGTWSHSFMAAVGDTVQYKWLNGTAWGFEETVPSDCQYPGDSNRGFEVPCEDYSHPVHCFGSCNPCGAATYSATFTVLTDNITVAADGMHVAGAFEGWSGTAMSDNGDGSWSITLDLEAGSYEFKFQNGLGGWEELDCGGNRSISIDGSGAVSYTGCFAQCGESTACVTDPDPANVTFQVDMSEVEDLNADSVYVIGSFTDPVWQAGGVLMSDADGDLIYEATVLISGPAGISYKFFNGNPYPNGVSTEEGGETADFAAGGCGVDNGVGGFNRTHTRSGSDETLGAVCFNSCAACGVADGTEVTFSVDMNNYGGTFGFVNVSGTWNDFCGDCNQMSDDDMDGIWTATIAIPEGENYRYKFQVDAWTDEEDLAPGDNPIGPCVVKSGGFTNRDLDVAGADPIALDTVCWASCLACVGQDATPGCTDDTASNYDAAATANDGTCVYDVTFSVNMSEYALAGTDSVYVNGEFNGWCGPCNVMLDEDGDGVYQTTIPLTYDYYEYKFTVNAWNAQEDLAGLGGCVTENFGFTNRVLQLFGNQSEPVVCWNSCSNCEGTGAILGCTDPAASNYAATATDDDGSCQYAITFQVDMAGYGGSYGMVNLNGSFAGWCGACIVMDDADGDGVYAVTVDVPAGTVEYKFTVDGWTDQENFTDGDVCTSTIDGFVNRTLDVSGAATLDVVCWNSCYSCDAPIGCTDSAAQNYDSEASIDDGSCVYLVTLRLDMSQQEVSPNGVHVAGSFQGWTPGTTPMSTQGLGLYEITLQLANGAHQFIYINDNDWAGQETVPAECGADNGLGGYNREVVVAGADAVLDVVCFNSCTACAGCTDPFSAEFSPFAGSDDGSCATPLVFGCTYPDADNYNAAANSEDGSCEFSGGSSCPTDIDGDGATAVGDLLIILGAFGQTCE